MSKHNTKHKNMKWNVREVINYQMDDRKEDIEKVSKLPSLTRDGEAYEIKELFDMAKNSSSYEREINYPSFELTHDDVDLGSISKLDVIEKEEVLKQYTDNAKLIYDSMKKKQKELKRLNEEKTAKAKAKSVETTPKKEVEE